MKHCIVVDCEGTSDLKHNQEAAVPVGERGNKLLGEKKKLKKNKVRKMRQNEWLPVALQTFFLEKSNFLFSLRGTKGDNSG